MASLRSSSLQTTVFAVPADNSLASLLVGEKWGGGVGEALTISYSFATTSSRYGYSGEWDMGGAPLDAQEQAAAEQALANYAAVADITFTKLTETTTTVGDIRFAESGMLARDGASAWSYTPDSGAWAADVWLNPTVFSTAYEDDPGSWNYLTLLHEIGHALGLKHSFEADLYSDAALPEATDTYHYTVMTYYAYPGDMWVEASIYPTTLMLYDIAAIQYLYGTNWDYAAGDDTYVYSGNGSYLETIWDGGGTDTIVYDSATGGVIDLREGEFSQLGKPVTYSNGASDPRTVAIAYGCQIENAVGGSGDDVIYANDARNDLDGGAGFDSVVYAGSSTAYAVTGSDVATVAQGADVDTLTGIEAIVFDDATYSAVVTYTYSFVYAGGDWYTGTVTAAAAAGYEVGDTIQAAAGTYQITGVQGEGWAAGGGAVAVDAYYDAETAAWYESEAAGSGGLGSESGYAHSSGWTVYDQIGYGAEADFAVGDTLYYFYYVDDDGDCYFGYVIDDGSRGYYEGYAIDPHGAGYYYIYDSYAYGYATGWAGYTNAYYYWDAGTGQAGYAYGYGWQGLGSEQGYAWSADGGTYDWFGYGAYEADLTVGDTLYYFYYVDDGGDCYFGYVIDDGSLGYYEGYAVDPHGAGYYYIYDSYAYGYTTGWAGYTNAYYYWDAGTGQAGYAYGYGWAGLGSEQGYAWSADGGDSDWFGYGYDEADFTVGDTLYYFYYVDYDGDYYFGTVIDDGSLGYHEGYAFDPHGAGYYYIYDSYDYGYATGWAGYTAPTGYYDADSGIWAYAWGYGWAGLGSEWGYAVTADWSSYDWFGYGYDEADLAI